MGAGTTIADSIKVVPQNTVATPLVAADAVKFIANDAEDVLYVHADHLASPQKMTDDTGAVVWDAAYTPFGQEASITGTAANDNRFPGQFHDTETALHYNYWRDYDPVLGRCIQSDPIGLAGGLNTYAYVGGNPITRIDRHGLIIDTLADLGFLSYDAYRIYSDNIVGSCGNLGENLLALGADAIGAALPFVTGLGLSVRGGKLVDDAADAARGKPDFVVTPDDTAVPTSQSQMRQGFDDAGFPSKPATETSESGIVHSVPTANGSIDVRTMEGGSGRHSRRAVTTTPGTNSPRTPSGRTPQGTRKERRDASHFEQIP